MILLYAASSFVTMSTLTAKPRIQAFYTPLFAVAIATLVFWRRQVWKFRLKDRRFEEKDRENALNSLAHEAANGVNAIRANLTAYQESNPHAHTDEHLQQVERALARIDAALEKSAAQPQDN
jgi:biopolymer transport protein ExbB/TolQ